MITIKDYCCWICFLYNSHFKIDTVRKFEKTSFFRKPDDSPERRFIWGSVTMSHSFVLKAQNFPNKHLPAFTSSSVASVTLRVGEITIFFKCNIFYYFLAFFCFFYFFFFCFFCMSIFRCFPFSSSSNIICDRTLVHHLLVFSVTVSSKYFVNPLGYLLVLRSF